MVASSPRQDPRRLLAELRQSGSSFYWAIRLLPLKKRTDLSVLYLFCRAVDDIADGPLPPAEKVEKLAAWKRFLSQDAPEPLDSELGWSVRDLLGRHPLLRSSLVEIIEGVSMDLPPGIQAPDDSTFTLYCRRVAGYVGTAIVRLLGCNSPSVDRFALAVGDALQITNILRDVKADAEAGRLYLPLTVLEQAGVQARTAQTILADPALPLACKHLAAIAEQHYQQALEIFSSAELSDEERQRLRPARVMLGSYRLLLRRLNERGWQTEQLGDRTRLSAVRLLLEALRCYAPTPF